MYPTLKHQISQKRSSFAIHNNHILELSGHFSCVEKNWRLFKQAIWLQVAASIKWHKIYGSIVFSVWQFSVIYIRLWTDKKSKYQLSHSVYSKLSTFGSVFKFPVIFSYCIEVVHNFLWTNMNEKNKTKI